MTDKEFKEYQKIKAEIELEAMAKLVDWWRNQPEEEIHFPDEFECWENECLNG